MLRTSEGAAAHKYVNHMGIDKASFSALQCRNLQIISDPNTCAVKYMVLKLKDRKTDNSNQGAQTIIGDGTVRQIQLN